MLSSGRTLEWKPLSQTRPVTVPAFGEDTDGLGRWVSQECTCTQVRGPEFGLQYSYEKFGAPIILALGRRRQADSWSPLASQPTWMVAPARHPTSKENKWNELLRKASDHLCPPDARISATLPYRLKTVRICLPRLGSMSRRRLPLWGFQTQTVGRCHEGSASPAEMGHLLHNPNLSALG